MLDIIFIGFVWKYFQILKVKKYKIKLFGYLVVVIKVFFSWTMVMADDEIKSFNFWTLSRKENQHQFMPAIGYFFLIVHWGLPLINSKDHIIWNTWTVCLVCWPIGIIHGLNIWLPRPIEKMKKKKFRCAGKYHHRWTVPWGRDNEYSWPEFCFEQFKLFSLFLIFHELFSNPLCLPSY